MKIVISSGENEVVLSPVAPLRLLEGGLEGFDSTGFDVAVTPYMDGNGGTVTRRRFAERRMKVRFEIGDNSAAADSMWRQKILTLMNPMRDCTVEVKGGDSVRRITAVPVEKVAFERKTLTDHTVVTLCFAAPEPFFRAASAVVTESAAGERGFTVTNPGDVPCGAVFTICAKGGAVEKPCISLGDAAVSVPLTLNDGDILEIDTRTGRKGVRINGEETLSFDWRSSFFSLEVGENMISADADNGKEYMAVFCEVVPLYFGI